MIKGIVGSAKGWLQDGIYRKQVYGSKHTFKKMDAWGMDKDIVDGLDGICNEIRVKDIENGIIYSIDFNKFKELAKPFNFTTMQLMLPKKYFELQ